MTTPYRQSYDGKLETPERYTAAVLLCVLQDVLGWLEVVAAPHAQFTESELTRVQGTVRVVRGAYGELRVIPKNVLRAGESPELFAARQAALREGVRNGLREDLVRAMIKRQREAADAWELELAQVDAPQVVKRITTGAHAQSIIDDWNAATDYAEKHGTERPNDPA